MKKIKVKVFNAYKSDNDEFLDNINLGWRDKFDFHMHIIDKDGYVWNEEVGFKVPDEYIEETYKYELEPKEKANLHTKKIIFELAEQKLNEAEQDYHNFFVDLFSKIDNSEDLFLSEWSCELSPIGNCICKWDGNDNTCIFCGEPDERK